MEIEKLLDNPDDVPGPTVLTLAKDDLSYLPGLREVSETEAVETELLHLLFAGYDERLDEFRLTYLGLPWHRRPEPIFNEELYVT